MLIIYTVADADCGSNTLAKCTTAQHSTTAARDTIAGRHSSNPGVVGMEEA